MKVLRRLLVGSVLVAACSPTPPTAPDAAPDPGQPPPMSQGSMGRFVGAGGHRGAGGVTLSIEDGRARLEFASDFEVESVPGPFVYLNTTSNANLGQPLRVAALERNRGGQAYTFLVPAGVRYTWVLVWCDPFNVPVAEASIPPTP